MAENVPASRPTPKPPPFKLFRYEEDYLFLRDPSRRTGPLDDLKYIPLDPDQEDTFLSLGGELRTRYEYSSSPGFGLRTDSHDDYVLQRILLHGDLRFGDREGLNARAFIQLVGGYVGGQELPKPPNQDNPLDLQQAFLDLSYNDTTQASTSSPAARFRVGRQELGLGSYRLITSREPTNSRLNFDGIRATYMRPGLTLDAFLLRPVKPEDGVFDDGQDDNTTFWGLYAVSPLIPNRHLSIDYYYLGLQRDNAVFSPGVGDETRHTFGTRLWGLYQGWDYDAEAILQFGSFDQSNDDLDIFAWTVASNTGYTFENASWKPRIGLKLNVASGDTDANDDRLGTFNPLFPRNNYFSDANLLAPYNFFDIHPSLQLRPSDSTLLTFAFDSFFRYSTKDAVFSPTGITIPANASDAHFVGSTLSAQFDYNINRHISWTVSYVHFFRGDVVTDAGGTDVDFFGTWLTFRF